MRPAPALLARLADQFGTPFWLYDAATLRQRIADVNFLTAADGIQARFAMKACPATRVLKEMLDAGIWVDAVSGNEVLRARRAGHPGGSQPPRILFTADVFRDNALPVLLENHLLPNIGSPGMIAQLAAAGYRGPVSLRVNPGFGHGHVNACDTGGPSSKHGIWHENLAHAAAEARRAGLQVQMLHAHIGSGPQFGELLDNLARLADLYVALAPQFPGLEAVSLGGGLPHSYRDPAPLPLETLRELLETSKARLDAAFGRPIRVEIEPGRYFVVSTCSLVTRVTDIKSTGTNAKGTGADFIMVDAGFVDLARPAMYGSFHRIALADKEDAPISGNYVVAGPLCESGDVFTRDDQELLAPRPLPRPEVGDLLYLADAGAYGYAMSSNYNSIGRAPQLMLEEDGSITQISRRETIDDILAAETNVTFP